MNPISFPSDRTQWFSEARFGMFVHWGLYSLLGRGEWVMNRERIPNAEYQKLADRFLAEDFSPKDWARIARQAGMRYIVLTTKHHEGFCLWNSKACAFNAVNSAAKRDLLKEFVEAVRDEGLKLGLYYSLGDWRHPDWMLGWQGDTEATKRFVDYTHTLVRELVTGYGKIDILWYDLPQNYSAAQWRAVELNAMVRSLQPHILINNRAFTAEDFGTPEQHVTAAKPGRLWESCMTLNRNWGYVESDKNFKSAREVVLTLAQVAAGGGNLLLNVGPTGSGRIPEESQRILQDVGQWLETNGESIYGCDRHGLSFNLWGPVTTRGQIMYLHLDNHFGSELTIGGLTPNILEASVLGDSSAIVWEKRDHRTTLRGLPPASPERLVTVIRLVLDGRPDQDISRVIGGADQWPELPN